jgi:hypothetical protein
MLTAPTIPKEASSEPALDHRQLYAAGLEQVEQLASRVWTDYNVHDPGITTLELLCYALTELSYRAAFPVQDLLASPAKNGERMKEQFFTAREILPNRALTLLDYRKLLIDLKGVKNAWLQPAALTFFADTSKGKLYREDPGLPHSKPVNVRGLYDVLVDLNEGITGAQKTEVLAAVGARLHSNRNLCEDFVSIDKVDIQNFLLCCELELSPEADVSEVEGEIYFAVEQYLAPIDRSYTLDEMLGRKKANGNSFTVNEIFSGPALDCGFIDDEELAQAELRDKIYLSDVISVIMDIEGVLAVRDIVINPAGTRAPLPNKWIVPVKARRKAQLDLEQSRLVYYKRNMPVMSDKAKVKKRYDEREKEITARTENAVPYDLQVPLGEYRHPACYYSFQNHFPALYGLSEYGLNGAADEKRKALAWQLKAYLLFFDQILANSFAQLRRVRELLSANPAVKRTYSCQRVKSFPAYDKIYVKGALASIMETTENANLFAERRNRFLDHLIARFAEQFPALAQITHAALGSTAPEMIDLKCDFLNHYPAISSERSLAYNYTLNAPADLWESANVSGLERRLAKLLGIHTETRRNLSGDDDGMYLIEMILLRPDGSQDPLVDVCPDPNCTDCAEEDPYSYRIHIILPAYQSRFADMNFRRFVEEIIRQETPSHVLPRICWIGQEEMAKLEKAYKDWISAKVGTTAAQRADKLKALIDILFTVRNVYPPQKLVEGDQPQDKFLLGQTALGTLKEEPNRSRKPMPGRKPILRRKPAPKKKPKPRKKPS